jgi:hypothetical protein
MALRKTTILPTDDPVLAQRLFKDLVHEQPYYIFVALGTGSEAETVVQRADNLTGNPTDPRWVIWARNAQQIRPAIAELKNSDRIVGKLGTARGFSISLSDEVRDVIDGTEPLPSLTRILLAFAEAEKP